LFTQRGDRSQGSLHIIVLGLQIIDHLRIVAFAQPEVIVDPHVSVLFKANGLLCRAGSVGQHRNRTAGAGDGKDGEDGPESQEPHQTSSRSCSACAIDCLVLFSPAMKWATSCTRFLWLNTPSSTA